MEMTFVDEIPQQLEAELVLSLHTNSTELQTVRQRSRDRLISSQRAVQSLRLLICDVEQQRMHHSLQLSSFSLFPSSQTTTICLPSVAANSHASYSSFYA